MCTESLLTKILLRAKINFKPVRAQKCQTWSQKVRWNVLLINTLAGCISTFRTGSSCIGLVCTSMTDYFSEQTGILHSSEICRPLVAWIDSYRILVKLYCVSGRRNGHVLGNGHIALESGVIERRWRLLKIILKTPFNFNWVSSDHVIASALHFWFFMWISISCFRARTNFNMKVIQKGGKWE